METRWISCSTVSEAWWRSRSRWPNTLRPDDLRSLRRFKEDYPQAKAFLLYAGTRRRHDAGIDIVPAEQAIRTLDHMIA